MKRSVPGFLKVAAVIVGTVIGAGFASGQEVMRFFTGYGAKGLGSMILSGLLFMWICYRVFLGKGKDYKAYLRTLMPGWAAVGVEGVTVLFMLFTYGAMLSGSGALMQQEWGWNFYAGLLAMAAVTMAVFLGGQKGLVWLNTILVPVLIVMLVWICLAGISRGTLPSAYLQTAPLSIDYSALPSLQFLGDGILYTSYNLLTLIPVLCTLRAGVIDKRKALAASVAGGGTLLGLSLILGLASLTNYDTMKGMEIPIFALLDTGKVQNILCCLVLLGAMLTTAVSDGYICIRYLRERGIVYQAAIFTVAGLGCGIGSLGFSSLVGKVYPFFGFLGLGLLLAIGLRRISGRQEREKEQFR